MQKFAMSHRDSCNLNSLLDTFDVWPFQDMSFGLSTLFKILLLSCSTHLNCLHISVNFLISMKGIAASSDVKKKSLIKQPRL